MTIPTAGADPIAALAALRGLRLIDLTRPLHAAMPVYPGRNALPFERHATVNLAEHGVNSGRVGLGEHHGTHLDAPIHFIANALAMHEIPADQLVAEAVVVDVTVHVSYDPDYRLQPEDLLAWEDRNGPFPAGAFALMHSGWGARWPDAVAYVSADVDGRPHHPACTPEAAMWLVERGALGLGLDTLSADNAAPSDVRSPAHKVLHGAGRYVLENLARLEELPERGILLIIGALPIVGGTAGPARVLAFID